MSKNISKSKSIARAKLVTELCIAAVVIAGGAYFVKKALDRTEVLGTSPFAETSEASEPEVTEPITEPDPNQILFDVTSVPTKDKFKGNLILVNKDYQFFKGDESIVSLSEKIDSDANATFAAEDYDVQLRDSIYQPLSSMFHDFTAATNIDDIVVYEGFRTNDYQKELYDNAEDKTGVAEPGHSEHETGLAFDVTTSTTWDYDGEGDYSWINKNCWKYGFILRYARNKQELTGMDSEPWHYRYVGIPHAYYMYEHDICLEEYIELLRTNYRYEGEHLKFSDETGSAYEIFFYPSDDGSETTNVPVPNDKKYDISGNNNDGFIITVYTEAAHELGEPANADSSESE